MLLLSERDVRAALSMADAIDAMRSALIRYSAGEVRMPMRSAFTAENGTVLYMPAHVQGDQEISIKLVTVYQDNVALGVPSVHASILLIDDTTGELVVLMGGTAITAIRTGATGALAVDCLARGDASVLTMIGAGVQARAQLEGIRHVRRLTEVRIVSRSAESAERMADEIHRSGDPPRICLGMPLDEAVAGADIVVAATNSHMPVFDGRALSPGTHVTGVGAHRADAREIDSVTVERAAKIVVESREAASVEAGDLLIPGVQPTSELGEILSGHARGRETRDEVTVFKSVGIAVQDAAAAAWVRANAERLQLGRIVDL